MEYFRLEEISTFRKRENALKISKQNTAYR